MFKIIVPEHTGETDATPCVEADLGDKLIYYRVMFEIDGIMGGGYLPYIQVSRSAPDLTACPVIDGKIQPSDILHFLEYVPANINELSTQLKVSISSIKRHLFDLHFTNQIFLRRDGRYIIEKNLLLNPKPKLLTWNGL